MEASIIVTTLFFFLTLGNKYEVAGQEPGYVESLLSYFVRDSLEIANEPPDQARFYKEYDFIIVGAGSAGCVVANRLTENPDWKVLLIEAGTGANLFMEVPVLANYLQFFPTNWKYFTQPSNSSCLGMRNGQCHWPRGKVMGGSSVLNYMIYTRGNRRDYDLWESTGNTGWGWSNVLPYFKKVEKFISKQGSPEHKDFHGYDGFMTVSDVPFRTKVADAFVDAANYMQPPQPIVDYNGPTQTGFNYLQVSMRNGTRMSSSKAYLHPIKRKNLHVKKNCQVTRVLINSRTNEAYGVHFKCGSKKYIVRATKEVILSSGTIGTPQLLMLSGVGPQQHLADLGIPILKDAMVGHNLQDHIAAALTFTIQKPYTLNTDRLVDGKTRFEFQKYHDGPLTVPGGCEALAFFDLLNPYSADGWADLEVLIATGGIGTEESLKLVFNLDDDLYKKLYKDLKNKEQITVFPMVMRPKSVGRLFLADKNPDSKPLIYPGYFTDPEGNDIKVAIAGIRKSREIFRTQPFKAMGAKLHTKVVPQCRKYKFDTDKYWECYARHLTFTIYHHVGTAKMGPIGDPTSVVDPRLRVIGVKNLRVIDASIMPIIISAHTNAPTYMIAEKGSDMIKEDWTA